MMKHLICRVRSFEIVGAHTLRVQFDDNTEQTIDFRPILRGELYGPLSDPDVFNQVRIDEEVGTLVWPNGADFDPETLHDWPLQREAFIELSRRWMGDQDPIDLASMEDAVGALRSGDFHKLIGIVESDWLDAKGSPYLLDTDQQRLELAKDVSALANADGGVILIGFRTTREPTVAGERIVEVRPFSAELVEPDRYRKVLGEWVYPPLNNIEVGLFPDPANNSKYVAAVIVDSKVTVQKPYLVTRTLDEAGRVSGKTLGFFERKRDQVPPTSSAQLQHLLASGQQFASIYERLDLIENAIRSLKESPPNSKNGGVDPATREGRLKEGRVAVERDDLPILYFTAVAQTDCSFPTLFRSRDERVVRMIENPPALRDQGFRIYADNNSEIMRGQLRRSLIRGRRLLELWQDGLLLFLGPGDEDLLAWAPSERTPIRINNFVLAELILYFCWFARAIFTEAEPKPARMSLTVGFDNLVRGGKPPLLSCVPDGKLELLTEPREVLESPLEVSESVVWDGFDPEATAGRLFVSIYNRVGYDSTSVPYVDGAGRLPAQRIIGSSLPSEAGTLRFS